MVLPALPPQNPKQYGSFHLLFEKGVSLQLFCGKRISEAEDYSGPAPYFPRQQMIDKRQWKDAFWSCFRV